MEYGWGEAWDQTYKQPLRSRWVSVVPGKLYLFFSLTKLKENHDHSYRKPSVPCRHGCRGLASVAVAARPSCCPTALPIGSSGPLELCRFWMIILTFGHGGRVWHRRLPKENIFREIVATIALQANHQFWVRHGKSALVSLVSVRYRKWTGTSHRLQHRLACTRRGKHNGCGGCGSSLQLCERNGACTWKS